MEHNKKLQAKLIQLVKNMDKEVGRLAKIVADNQKREIKECSAAMRNMMSQMTTGEMYSVMRSRHPAEK